MSFQRHKYLLIVVVAAVVLMVASPVLQQLLVYPKGDDLTEFWILGEDYDVVPSNVTTGQNHRVNLGVRNLLGYSADYMVQIKFSADPASSPDSFTRRSSTAQELSRIRFSLADSETYETTVDFSFEYHGGESITMDSITINGATSSIDTSIPFDEEREGYFGNLIFELWIFNTTTNSYQYHDRYVNLWLKMLG